MIQVLRDSTEVETAIAFFRKNAIPLHATPQKNWDHYLAANFLLNLDKAATIADLGCGDGHSLTVYHKLGFRKLVGVDRKLSAAVRLGKFSVFLHSPGTALGYALRRSEITATGLQSESTDFISCISVIEHGVPIAAFARECYRILKPNGAILITTDYWHNWSTDESKSMDGSEWRIFNERTLSEVVKSFADAGLRLLNAQSIPECKDQTVEWEGRQYTFAALWFVKTQ